jgi:phosphotransferase system enzyme I (PtsI)
MISNLGEILEIKKILEITKSELLEQGKAIPDHLPIGIMIEVPSAAILASRFAKHVDFFSLGTNDLIQYTLAVDRNNERVAEFYQPLNPAILELVHSTIKAGNDAGIDVSLCGEMAGNPLYTAMLLGFGLRHFSMSPVMLPEVKERVRALSLSECEKIAKEILTKDSANEIADILWTYHHKINKKQSIPLMDRGEAIQS